MSNTVPADAAILILRLPGLGDIQLATGIEALDIAHRASVDQVTRAVEAGLVPKEVAQQMIDDTDCEDPDCVVHGRDSSLKAAINAVGACTLSAGCSLRSGHDGDCLVIN